MEHDNSLLYGLCDHNYNTFYYLHYCVLLHSPSMMILSEKWSVKCNLPQQQNKLCWFKGNYEKINAQLNKIDWNLKLAQGDINNLWQRFADELKIIYEENIPESKSMSRKYDTPGSGHYSDSPLFRQPIAPTAHYSDSPLLRQPISPTTHYSVKNGQK